MSTNYSRIGVKDDGKMFIRLYKDEADSLLAVALKKSEKFESITTTESSPYGFNHAHSHYVGIVAEHAAYTLFTEIENMLGIDLKIDPVYKDETREGECDLIVGGKRIEVKGIKYGAYKNFGPCISIRQVKRIKKKADIVMWVLFNEKSKETTFIGFNNVDEIETITPIWTGAEGRKKIENYPVQSLIKNLNELALC